MTDIVDVYGIGNPLIDVLVNTSDAEVSDFGLVKGTMNLIEPDRGAELLASLTHKEKRYACGGSCPNTLIALSAFGARTVLAGKIGTDELGEVYDQRLRRHGVHSKLKTHEGVTGTSLIMVTPDSERTMNTHLGTCRHFCEADVDFDLIAAAQYLHFTGYMWDTESQKRAVISAIERAKDAGTTIVFDVADPFAAERNREEFEELIREHVDIVFANSREAELLLGTGDPAEAARMLGVHTAFAVVKAGVRGSYVQEAGESVRHVPATYTDNVVDTTGAGDVYAAGFIHGLLRGKTAAEAGAFAGFVASKIIGKLGAQFDEQEAGELAAAFETERYKDAAYVTS